MRVSRRFLRAACGVLLMLALGAGTVLAGEVKGPPGTINNTNETGALDHANSACAASGLNDLDQTSGQTVRQTQTAADSWRFYGLAPGAPGELGPCRGGTRHRWRSARNDKPRPRSTAGARLFVGSA